MSFIATDERETTIRFMDVENIVEFETTSPGVAAYVEKEGGPKPTSTESMKGEDGTLEIYVWTWRLGKRKARKLFSLFSESAVSVKPPKPPKTEGETPT